LTAFVPIGTFSAGEKLVIPPPRIGFGFWFRLCRCAQEPSNHLLKVRFLHFSRCIKVQESAFAEKEVSRFDVQVGNSGTYKVAKITYA
jgi:hypothetical protein